MGVVSPARRADEPVIIFLGKQARYGHVNGKPQALHHFLFSCFIHQQELARMDSKNILDWLKQFLGETSDLCSCKKYLLSLCGGHRSHKHPAVVNLLKTSRVAIVGLPCRTLQLLQPFEVSVFLYFKPNLQK